METNEEQDARSQFLLPSESKFGPGSANSSREMRHMMRCVLVATDGSDAALAAVKSAADLVRTLGPDARLHVVSAGHYVRVPGPLGRAPDGAPDLLAEQAPEALASAKSAVEGDGGPPVSTITWYRRVAAPVRR